MSLDVGGGERADGNHVETALADVVQRSRDEPAAHAFALELVGDFRVDEHEPVRLLAVIERARRLTVDARLIPARRRVVDDLDFRAEAHSRERRYPIGPR